MCHQFPSIKLFISYLKFNRFALLSESDNKNWIKTVTSLLKQKIYWFHTLNKVLYILMSGMNSITNLINHNQWNSFFHFYLWLNQWFWIGDVWSFKLPLLLVNQPCHGVTAVHKLYYKSFWETGRKQRPNLNQFSGVNKFGWDAAAIPGVSN